MAFSIIICTYNPDQSILKRLIEAIRKFDTADITYEVLIVDNNSVSPVGEIDFISSFIQDHSNVYLSLEKNPGLTAARINGISNAKYDWLIFFDDDNEPAPDYLIEAKKVIEKVPKVLAWGPGNIKVVFTDPKTPDWLRAHTVLFQQRLHSKNIFGFNKETDEYYPDGTGLCIKREIAMQYADKVQTRLYTLSDRNGKALSSGGDLQMVLTATNNGGAVGRAEGLKINHYINGKKANLRYILKMIKGVEACNYPAHNEVIHWSKDKVDSFALLTNIDFLKIIYNAIFIKKLKSRDTLMKIAMITGQQTGVALLRNKESLPFFIRLAVALIDR